MQLRDAHLAARRVLTQDDAVRAGGVVHHGELAGAGVRGHLLELTAVEEHLRGVGGHRVLGPTKPRSPTSAAEPNPATVLKCLSSSQSATQVDPDRAQEVTRCEPVEPQSRAGGGRTVIRLR